ncbi:MAG: hypothetical protein IAI49_07110, partial [Candidatus Eremiobacteraeota bacterium]|nr:hypothetical protein [Candidatus Eremiobacteraeota bacterium]
MGARADLVILAAEQVVDLQFFLMDAAKHHVARGSADRTADELLSKAASLDYVLLLCCEHADETIDATSAVGTALCETMTRAVDAALDVVERMLEPAGGADRSLERDARARTLFDVVRSLRERGIVGGDRLAFRTVTLENDLL